MYQFQDEYAQLQTNPRGKSTTCLLVLIVSILKTNSGVL